MIREQHPEGRVEEAHVFDRWWHIGTARDEESLAALGETRVAIEFDPDIYKIVQAFIRKRRGSVRELADARSDRAELEAAE